MEVAPVEVHERQVKVFTRSPADGFQRRKSSKPAYQPWDTLCKLRLCDEANDRLMQWTAPGPTGRMSVSDLVLLKVLEHYNVSAPVLTLSLQ